MQTQFNSNHKAPITNAINFLENKPCNNNSLVVYSPLFSFIDKTTISPCQNINHKNIELNTTIASKAPTLACKPPVIDEEYNSTLKNEAVKKHNVVEPFTDDEILRIKEYFYNTPSRFKNTNMRNYAFFVLSINCGKRAGDILNLRIGNILNDDGTFKTHLVITNEQKTGKYSKTLFVPKAQEAIAEYLNLLPSYSTSDFLFQNYKTGKAIEVGGMRKMMKKMAQDLDISHNVGTHSNRKTFATHAFNNDPLNTKLISKILCHAKPETTETYIRNTQLEQDNFLLRNQI